MNRIIHKGFFREMCRQLRTKGLVATFILLGLDLIQLAAFAMSGKYQFSLTHLHQSLMLAPTYIFLYAATPMMAFSAYRWLNRRSQSDFYHAIPLTRLQLYGSTTAAILLWLYIPITAHTLMQVLLYTLFGSPFNYLLQLCVYLNVLIAALTILGAISIGCSVTGSGFVGFFTAVVILFYPRAFMMLAMLIEYRTQSAVPFSQQPFFLNPSFNIAATPFHTLLYMPDLGNVLAMLYSLLYGLALLALGGFAFHRRKSEAADIPYTSKVLQTAVRVAIGSAPLLGYAALIALFYDEIDFSTGSTVLIPLLVTSLLFSFVFYCLFELISSKRWNKVVKAMPFYLICLALAAIILFVPQAAGNQHTVRRIDADEVTGYEFVGRESTPLVPHRLLSGETDYLDVIAAKHRFTDRDGIERYTNYSSNSGYDLTSDTFGIVRLLGVNKVRGTEISWRTSLENCLLNDDAFRKTYYAFPQGNVYYLCRGLTKAESKEVGKLFKADYEALSDADRKTLMISRGSRSGYNYGYDPSATGLAIELYGCLGTENYTETFLINELTPNAARRYLELVNARYGEKTRSDLQELVHWMETGDGYPSAEFMLGNSGNVINIWTLEVPVDGVRYQLPKDTHPTEYAILKALSEAPLSADPEHSIIVYAPYKDSDTSVNRIVPVGFTFPEQYRDAIRAWVKSGMINSSDLNFSSIG